MNWIKTHYDQFTLALIAVALLGLSGMLIARAKSFPENFAAAKQPVVPTEKVPALELTQINAAQEALKKPALWRSEKNVVSENVFVPQLYVIDKETQLPQSVTKGSENTDSLTGQSIPNTFFIENNLPALDPTVTTQDPDKDGFFNEDEFRGTRDPQQVTAWSNPTNPNDANSHPPYYTKLFLKQWIRVPFRLKFQAYDGDPAKPEAMDFQINAVDRGRRTEFLKIGEKVAQSPFKLQKFEKKERVNPSTQESEDVSELTVVNTESGDTVILVLTKETDSPDSYALFNYEWDGKEVRVKKLKEFSLPPDATKLYKLIDIKEGQAVIQLPDSTVQYLVVPDPRRK